MSSEPEPIRIGISSCLIGEKVRYNGDHKHNRYLTAVLGEFLTFVPCCPEVAIGLGIPRPVIQLQRIGTGVRAVMPDADNRDVTDDLAAYAEKAARAATQLSGYIFKARSPSCGMERVKVHDSNGIPAVTGTGIYAGVIKKMHPLLPTEEEDRLGDPGLRDNFLERVLLYHGWRQLLDRRFSAADLITFHAENKFLLMSRNRDIMRKLDLLLASPGGDIDRIAATYIERFMVAMVGRARKTKRINVLQYMAESFRNCIDKNDEEELKRAIDDYDHDRLPIIVPLTLIRQHLHRNPAALPKYTATTGGAG